MSNPFDDADGEFLVLRNEEEQCSLWPTFKDVPNGWTQEFGPASLVDATDYIEANWTDIRPKSLRESLSDG